MEQKQRWWDKAAAESDDPFYLESHSALWDLIGRLEEAHSEYFTRCRLSLANYLSRQVGSLKPGEWDVNESPLDGEYSISLNVTQSCIDTLSAKICTNFPRPQFLTSGADHALKQRAKKLDKFVEGVFYAADIYAEGARSFIDALVFGTGYVKVYVAGGRVHCERVFPTEVMVDELAAFASAPRAMYQRKAVPVEVLLEQYPDNMADILEAARMVTKPLGDNVSYHEQVDVVEGWHLPSGAKSDDGRHVVAIKTATLVNEEYTADSFPIIPIRWTRKPYGFYGQGLSEQLSKIQLEINHLLQRIQAGMHLMSTAWIVARKGAIGNKASLTNEPGTIVEVEGPLADSMRIVTPPSINSEVFHHVRWLRDQAYEISGVSQLSASGKKPAGVESGRAIRTLLDVESQRFGLAVREWEGFFLEIARHVVRAASAAYAGGGSIDYRSKDFVEEIPWSEVSIDENKYVLKLYPTAMLPREPAGRMATVQEMVGGPLGLSPAEGRALLDWPDLERYESLANADINAIDALLDKIVEDGELVEPHVFMNLELAKKRGQQRYLEHYAKGDAELLEAIDHWIKKCDEKMKAAAAPMPGAPMPGGAPGPTPGGAPLDLPAAEPAGALDGLVAPVMASPAVAGPGPEGGPQ